MGQARVFGALSDTNRRFVKHDIDPFHDLAHEMRVADVPLDQAHITDCSSGFKVAVSSPGEVVKNHDFASAFGGKPVGDM